MPRLHPNLHPAEKLARRIARFHQHILKDKETGCWNWTGSKVNRYGVSKVKGRSNLAHRSYWLLVVGPIPSGFDLDHTCRNRSCLNPAHLEPVTRGENLKRGFTSRGCRNGHASTPENTSLLHHANGTITRRCKLCHRSRNKKAKAKRSTKRR